MTKVLLAAILLSAGGISLAAAQTMKAPAASAKGVTEAQARYDLMSGPCGSSGISDMKKDAQGNWTAECASDGKYYTVSTDGKVSPKKE